MYGNWLVTCNISKTNFVSFHRHRSDPESSPVKMTICYVNEDTYFERLSGLKFNSDLMWNSYIQAIAKDAGKNSRLTVVLNLFCHALSFQVLD